MLLLTDRKTFYPLESVQIIGQGGEGLVMVRALVQTDNACIARKRKSRRTFPSHWGVGSNNAACIVYPTAHRTLPARLDLYPPLPFLCLLSNLASRMRSFRSSFFLAWTLSVSSSRFALSSFNCSACGAKELRR